MRALLVCAAPVVGTCELLGRLAASVDFVIAVDGGGAVCLEAGVQPDVVVGDMDSLAPGDLDRLRELGADIYQFSADKDASDLELAVIEARRRGATSIVVTAASSGRPDHALAALGVMLSARDLSPHLAEPEVDIWVLSTQGRALLSLEGEGATVSLVAFGSSAVVSVKGVVWELDEIGLDPTSSLGLSNRIGDGGCAQIAVSEGVILAIAPQVNGAVRAQAI
ncbi:MAG: thiamine diphosphokinase [Coriobacteriia bacterium]